MAAKIATRNKNSEKKTEQDMFRVVFASTGRDLYPGTDGFPREEAKRHNRDTVADTKILPLN